MPNNLSRSMPAAFAGALLVVMTVGCDSEAALGDAAAQEGAAVDPVSSTPPAPCPQCGTITSIQELTRKGDATGLGAATGAVIGGVIGRSVANKRKDVVTVVGAIGGGVAGHEIEKQIKSETYYEIAVRMEDGRTQMLYAEALYGLAPGAEVEVVGDMVKVRAGT
ncbi:MAG: glycine zipper 2TM domain-containing protein [Gammaproteobacteria bacterium]|nr:glycine zipper 2TM domain-containing protein [Gammaproteobacteria bacterium]